MFLKALTMKGFKSFADPTTLELEPGVTVVVGPNGSGKSNVVDAIGWVLGAQAPSTVRSQKMEDVIFAGTVDRPALGRAEVALTIDNSAGLLPIAFSEITVTRTLWRSGESEYAINGVSCRLLDIQELLSDTGVGRQQHVIVSQGQIDGVLNARPEDRRMIIEEAAGVLKYRRRKEKAERRLAATEGNLTRLQDLLREVRRNLRPLERQAEAARRHGAVVGELGALRIWLTGQDLARLRARLEASERTRRESQAEEARLRTKLAALDTEVLAAEARLSAMGGDDLGDALVRFESLREKARGLAAVLTERRRGIERDRGAAVDEDVIASLEAEAARLGTELAEVDEGIAALVPDADRLTVAETELERARLDFEDEWTGAEELAPSGQAAEVRGELGARRSGLARAVAEIERGRERLALLDDKAARLTEEARFLEAAVAEAEEARPRQQADVARARERVAAAEAELEAAQDAHRRADGDHRAWLGRADALALALDEARARAGAERLGQVSGVLGTVLDLVEVDEGWEAAFEAAAGEALAAVVVADAAAGRRALEALARGDVSGAVLPLGVAAPAAAGRGAAPASAGGQFVAVPVGEALRAHVRPLRPDVAPLLDRLAGAVAVCADWPTALDAAVAHPDAVVVTRTGDRFGPGGWRVGGSVAGATGAALAEARQRAEAAGEAASSAEGAGREARAAVDAARRHEVTAARALDQVSTTRAAADDALTRVIAGRDDSVAESTSVREHLAELDERVRHEQAEVVALEAALPALEAEEARAIERTRVLTEARRRLEERAGAVSLLRNDLEVRAASLDERRQFLRRRLGEIEDRLARDVEDRRRAEGRRIDLDRRARATNQLLAIVTERLTVVEAEVAQLRDRRRRQSEAAREVAAALDRLRRDRASTERLLSERRELLQRAELDEAEVRLRTEALVEALRHELDVEPSVALAAPAPELPAGTTAVVRVRELERDLRLMGPINPLALEEFNALQERHKFLDDQLEDVRTTRRELAKVIRAVDTEIVGVFSSAFADVAINFQQLFETLFPGGQGRLRLTEPDDLLGTGIEIEAKPSGKNVKKLSLLSGGERSLTALAYLFAVFRARPSPFYVMDEVEAALDDINLHRFLGLVAEFRAEAQLVIVSHQKRTMEAADCLYGVTMQSGGSSRVVSERVAAR